MSFGHGQEASGQWFDRVNVLRDHHSMNMRETTDWDTQLFGQSLVVQADGSFVLVYTANDTAAAVKSFLTVSANQGQANLSAAGFVPLPDSFKERLLKSVDAIA